MFSYGLWEGGGGYLITESCAVAKKIYRKQERMSILSCRKTFFPCWFGILTMKILGLAIS